MSVAHKNLYDLLGNDDEGSETPVAPVKTVTKTSIKTAKPSADGTGPTKDAPAGGARSGVRGGFSANEAAFRDGGVGSGANRRRPTDEAPRGGPRGGRGARGRGGPGATRHRNADDRHAKNIAPGSEKQAAQAWGAPEGQAELKDEQAGEAIAEAEQKDAEAEDAEAESKEPEPKQVTLEDYLAEQAQKKLALNESAQSVRKANEGTSSKDQKKWDTAVPIAKEDEEVTYIAPSGGKAKKEKAKKGKEIFAWDGTWQESNDRSRGGRGGRGGPRGGDRGGPRGGQRGGPRGGRGGVPPPNANDKNAFPTLGGN